MSSHHDSDEPTGEAYRFQPDGYDSAPPQAQSYEPGDGFNGLVDPASFNEGAAPVDIAGYESLRRQVTQYETAVYNQWALSQESYNVSLNDLMVSKGRDGGVPDNMFPSMGQGSSAMLPGPQVGYYHGLSQGGPGPPESISSVGYGSELSGGLVPMIQPEPLTSSGAGPSTSHEVSSTSRKSVRSRRVVEKPYGVAPKFVDLTPEAMVKLNLAITTYMMDLGIDGYYLYPADNDTHDLLQPAPLYIVLMKAVLEKVYFRIYGKLQLPSHKAKMFNSARDIGKSMTKWLSTRFDDLFLKGEGVTEWTHESLTTLQTKIVQFVRTKWPQDISFDWVDKDDAASIPASCLVLPGIYKGLKQYIWFEVLLGQAHPEFYRLNMSHHLMFYFSTMVFHQCDVVKAKLNKEAPPTFTNEHYYYVYNQCQVNFQLFINTPATLEEANCFLAFGGKHGHHDSMHPPPVNKEKKTKRPQRKPTHMEFKPAGSGSAN